MIRPILLVFVALLLSLPGRAQQPTCPAGVLPDSYRLTPLGAGTRAADVNNNAQVVGTRSFGRFDDTPFLWERHSGPIELPLLPEPHDDEGQALAINDTGEIVGFSTFRTTSSVHPRPVYWPSISSIVDLSPDLVIPNCSSAQGIAADINEGSEIVGRARSFCNTGSLSLGFLWDPDHGLIARLGDPRNTEGSEFIAMNNSGQVTGRASFSSSALVWSPASPIRPLERLHASPFPDRVPAINDSGTVAGTARLPDNARRAVVWNAKTGEVDPLETLEGPPHSSAAFDINEFGHVVGFAQEEDQRKAVLWDANGRIHRLADLVDHTASGWELRVEAINDKGQIVGTGTNPDGEDEAFLLDPMCSQTPSLFSGSITTELREECVGATFKPSTGVTIEAAAAETGYDHFNWLNIITVDNTLLVPGLRSLVGLEDEDGELPSVPYFDPVPGGYQYQAEDCNTSLPVRDRLPWYWDEVFSLQAFGCKKASNDVPSAQDAIASISEESFIFEDCPEAPADIEFLTGLVGVNPDGSGELLEETVFRWRFEGIFNSLFTGLEPREFEELSQEELNLIEDIPVIRGNLNRDLLSGSGSLTIAPTRPDPSEVHTAVAEFTEEHSIGVRTPNGSLLGDIDGDRDVDRDDLEFVLAARDALAVGPEDPRDLDDDGQITALDSRKLALLCTRPRCSVTSSTACGLGFEIAPVLMLLARLRACFIRRPV